MLPLTGFQQVVRRPRGSVRSGQSLSRAFFFFVGSVIGLGPRKRTVYDVGGIKRRWQTVPQTTVFHPGGMMTCKKLRRKCGSVNHKLLSSWRLVSSYTTSTFPNFHTIIHADIRRLGGLWGHLRALISGACGQNGGRWSARLRTISQTGDSLISGRARRPGDEN